MGGGGMAKGRGWAEAGVNQQPQLRVAVTRD